MWLSALTVALGSGLSGGARALLPLLLLGIAAKLGLQDLPPNASWLQSVPALGVLAAAVLVEELLERDDDLQEVVAPIKYAVHGTGGAVVSYVLVERLHLGLAQWVVVLIAIALSLVTHGLRMKLHDALRDIEVGFFSPRSWLSWMETGGVLGLVVAMLLAPFLVVGMALLAAVLSGVLMLVAKFVENTRRRPCPTCGNLVRKEASLCPYCKEPLQPVRWMGRGKLERLELGDALDTGGRTRPETTTRAEIPVRSGTDHPS